MRLPQFNYTGPDTLEKALDLLAQRGPDAKILAGGTDLLVRMKKGLLAPKYLISRGRGLRIGEQTAWMIRLPDDRTTSAT